MPFLLFAAIFWVAPIVAGHKIGAGKNRAGWAWGLLLGWIGVLIVALLGPAKKTENRSLRFTAPNDAAKPRAVATRIGPPPNVLAAGWYPDPQDAGNVRYWDGTGWTHYVDAAANAAASQR